MLFMLPVRWAEGHRIPKKKEFYFIQKNKKSQNTKVNQLDLINNLARLK